MPAMSRGHRPFGSAGGSIRPLQLRGFSACALGRRLDRCIKRRRNRRPRRGSSRRQRHRLRYWTRVRITRLHVTQESLEGIYRDGSACDVTEFLGAERRRYDFKGALVRRLCHLGRVLFMQPRQAEGVLAKRETGRGAQNVGALDTLERLKIVRAFAVIKFDLFGGGGPTARRPEDVGAQANGRATVDMINDLERDIMASELGQSA